MNEIIEIMKNYAISLRIDFLKELHGNGSYFMIEWIQINLFAKCFYDLHIKLFQCG